MEEKQPTQVPQPGQEFKPGDTVSPAQPVQAASVPPVAPVLPSPEPAPESALPEETQTANPAPQADSFDAGGEEPLLHWTASEFIAHDKSAAWYLALLGGAAAIAAVVYLLTKDLIATAVVLIAGVALSAYAGRKPQQIAYALFDEGLLIGRRSYLYSQFRSFSLTDEGHMGSISLLPHKRFGQLVTLYFDLQDQPLIMDVLASRLPLEKRAPDFIDGFMKKIRF